jgi:hypothetical protein
MMRITETENEANKQAEAVAMQVRMSLSKVRYKFDDSFLTVSSISQRSDSCWIRYS